MVSQREVVRRRDRRRIEELSPFPYARSWARAVPPVDPGREERHSGRETSGRSQRLEPHSYSSIGPVFPYRRPIPNVFFWARSYAAPGDAGPRNVRRQRRANRGPRPVTPTIVAPRCLSQESSAILFALSLIHLDPVVQNRARRRHRPGSRRSTGARRSRADQVRLARKCPHHRAKLRRSSPPERTRKSRRSRAASSSYGDGRPRRRRSRSSPAEAKHVCKGVGTKGRRPGYAPFRGAYAGRRANKRKKTDRGKRRPSRRQGPPPKVV